MATTASAIAGPITIHGSLQRLDHVVGTGFQPRPVGQPDGQAQDRPGQRADDTHQDAVDPDHEADVPVGGAQGSEHAERAQPRCFTVKPPTATRAMSSMPTVTSPSTMGSGSSGLPATRTLPGHAPLADGAE